MKVREVVRMLHADGWFEKKSGRVTVPGKPNGDLAPGTLNSILKQAGLKRR
jgi:predicted RNA binding protein YcfA (HicA-like mRNA interferase family)